MTTITFDTLKYANRLKAAGVPDKQAEAMADAQAEVQQTHIADVATKRDLKELKLEIAAELAPLKWGMAITVGGIVALILKSFFPH
ncbi:MAG TPA: DUF1640 domain-containing protein [Magnetococcales bacterium]|nr:DUF1640 domain-containing protein [Magnetococcales bacterium]